METTPIKLKSLLNLEKNPFFNKILGTTLCLDLSDMLGIVFLTISLSDVLCLALLFNISSRNSATKILN